MKILSKKIFSATMAGSLTMLVCSSLPMSYASDIEIYRDATQGKPHIFLMLDTSGSMGISSLVMPKNNKYGSPGDVDSSLCELEKVLEPIVGIGEWQYNAIDRREYISKNGRTVPNTIGSIDIGGNILGGTRGLTSFYKEVKIGDTYIPYFLRGCGTASINSAGKLVESATGKFDRLSRMKDAIITLLASDTLTNDTVMGLGHFSAKTDLKVGKANSSSIYLVDGHSGAVLVPNAPLSTQQRITLAKKIAEFQSLDTTTTYLGLPTALQKVSSLLPPNLLKASSGTPTAHAYAEAAAYMMGKGTGGNTIQNENKYLFDGSAIIRKDFVSQSDKDKVGGKDHYQSYWICVKLQSQFEAHTLGYDKDDPNVKQCENSWPSLSRPDGKVTRSGRIFKPLDGAKPGDANYWQEVTTSYTRATYDSNGNVNSYTSSIPADYKTWQVYHDLPEGWRLGGWMKVNQEPMDIEPISGKVWGQTDVGEAGNGLFIYRTNPFSLNDKRRVELGKYYDDGYEDNLVGGFRYSIDSSKNTSTNTYIKGGSTNSCDGNGIYFLTDGAPNSTKDNMAQTIMNHTLGGGNQFSQKPIGADVLKSPILTANLFSGETGGWEYIGEYAKKLFDKTKNPAAMSIRTAVVGFGSSFSDLKETKNCEAIKTANPTGYNQDAYNACKWGSDSYGAGGFYFAENVEDIQNSIINFVKKVEVNIDPIVTGSPTLPVDSLNPTQLQPYAYYATLEPNVQKPYQLWLGNLNKYRVLNGELYSSSSLIKLLTDAGTLNKIATGFWNGGALEQLNLKSTNNSTNRRIFTNRTVTGSASSPVVGSSNTLKSVNLDAFFSSDESLAYLKNDPKKNYWLNALGYKVIEGTTVNQVSDLQGTNEIRQLGAVLHSTPMLLTQEGRINSNLTTSGRKDYLLYGSTQGILHVVDAETGKEIFGFIPSEMMENQPKAFIGNDLTTGGTTNLFYGIDGPWAAYTEYVAKKDGTLTVSTSDRSVDDETLLDEKSSNSTARLKGKQWVYGGLRMGGKSYYGLDLSDLSDPKLKLHINPSATNAKAELKKMGQSWSKPTVGYVKWGGKKKLVMFVGGGYDATGTVTCTVDSSKNNKGYECPTYHQTNQVGAGVYMFDAENGDLLWWSSSNRPTGYDSSIRFTANTDLQYSVASQINAIDRNGDGLVDHLYFGDLAGQAFRVDLNNSLKVEDATNETSSDVIVAKDKFGSRVVTLFSEDKNITTGLKPRFYEMPSISIHTDSDSGTRFAAVAFSSGNRSTPLASNTVAINNTSTASPKDGVFVVYDKDVVKADLYKDGFDVKTKNIALQNLVLKQGVPLTGGGWRSYFSATAGSFKGMNELYALDNMLYVNVYHKDGAGTSGDCGAGVRGDSYLFQYCLPTGRCNFYGDNTTEVNKVKIGVGILGTGLGDAYNNAKNQLSIVVNRDSKVDCTQAKNKNLPECQLFNNKPGLKQLRWYETQ